MQGDTNNPRSLKYYRLSVIVILGCYFIWSFSIAYHDWFYPQVNFKFITFILAGTTDDYSSKITNLNLIRCIFYTCVIFESMVMLIFSYSLILAMTNFQNCFFKARMGALIGLNLLLIKYFMLFVCIASEWFYMWQTAPQTQIKALVITVMILVTMVYIKSQPNSD